MINKVIIFSNQLSNKKAKIRINNEDTEREYENKFMGVTVDYKLWS